MRIIDGHVHVFEMLKGFGRRGELRAIGDGKARWANGEEISILPKELGEKACLAEDVRDFLLSKGVEKAVLLQGSFYGFQNEYVYEVVEKYPEFFVGAGTFDPFCKDAERIYERLTKELKFQIIKFEMSSGGGLMGYHNDFNINQVFQSIFENIEKAGQVLVLDVGSPGMESFQINEVRKLALKYPKMKIVICHLLAPTLQDTDVFEGYVKELDLDNIWLDLAAVPWNVYPEEYPYSTGVEYIKTAKKYLGEDKLIWGTDIPSTLTKESYEGMYSFITEANIFSEEELNKVMYQNAMDVYFNRA